MGDFAFGGDRPTPAEERSFDNYVRVRNAIIESAALEVERRAQKTASRTARFALAMAAADVRSMKEVPE